MKFRVLALIAALTLNVGAFAVDIDAKSEHVLGGAVSGFIKKDKSPYLVQETIVVPEDKALIIEAGVHFKFAEGVGLDVRGGSLAIMGEHENLVYFEPVDSSKYWNGISVTGIKKSEVQGLLLKNADYGFAIESGALELRDAQLENCTYAALYVRNASVDIQWSKIQNGKNIGIWVTESGTADIDGSFLANNRLGLVVAEGATVNLHSSRLQNNEVALFDLGNNRISQNNSLIEKNTIGVVSVDLPPQAIKLSSVNNKNDLSQNVAAFSETLGDEPRNPFANKMKFVALQNTNVSDSIWNVSGNVGIEFGYHKVLTRKNRSDEPYISGDDTVLHGKKYINYFQVPNFFANWNANLVMESPYGQTFEVLADVSSDEWDNFKVHQFTASYTDDNQRLVLGDFYTNFSELYLAGINAFGATYQAKVFKNAAGEPLFVGDIFAGETRAPKIEGERNYDVYKDYVDDGEAEAQEITIGGKLRWNMHRRFNGALGFIGSKDYLEDPFFRDGQSGDVNVASPMVSSRTFFADGNWLFFPGDIKFSGQVAVGGADTSNVAQMRAINQVFTDAGLDAENFALLNKLMKNPNKVNSLSTAELESIYGDNSLKTPTEMRTELKMLLERASQIAKETDIEDSRPSKADFWGHDHWAFAGSYEWSNANTFIEGFFRYVGREYYSAGSPDLLQNTRLLGGNLKQKIFDFWKLSFGYTMNVENAADGHGGYNIFGMGEGTRWGLFSGADSDWLKEHEQDANRTLHIHDAYLGNDFKLNDKISLSLKYAINYRTRSTSQRLYANYSMSSGIYDDSWFDAQKGHAVIDIVNDNDTLKIDSARWAAYYDLASEDYLATQFTEKLLKHTIELGVAFKLPKNELKIGGVVIVRTDLSEFEQDDLLDDFDFSDKTYGILGYYFHGGDFVEQRYPISLTTNLDKIKNTFAFTPRYKIYNRNDMREFEWNLSDNLNVVLSKDLLELSVNGTLRQNFLSYEIDNTDYDDTEFDIDGSASLRVYHNRSKTLYSDWTLGSVYNYRPDSRSDEYKDFYAIAALNYEF